MSDTPDTTATRFGLPTGQQVSPTRTAGLAGLSPRQPGAVPAARHEAPPAPLAAVPEPYSPRGDADLDGQERADLDTCERAVASLHSALAVAGKALAAINSARLYRETHPTFDLYVEERWGIKRSQAYRLIDAWPVAAALSPIGDTPESHVRELLPAAKAKGVDQAAAIYTELRDEGGRVTAARVRDAVRSHLADDIEAKSAGTEPATPADADPVAAVQAALKAQRAAWSALAPAAVEAALAADPTVAKDLEALEVQAGRTAKRARHRPRA